MDKMLHESNRTQSKSQFAQIWCNGREKHIGKIKMHNGIQKSKIPIEINKVHNQFMEVTTLPPSFDYWNKNLVHSTLSLI
jgi:hypothetical protein